MPCYYMENERINEALNKCFPNEVMQWIANEILLDGPGNLQFESLKAVMGIELKTDVYGYLVHSLIFQVPVYLPDFTRPKKKIMARIRKKLTYPIRMFKKRDPNPAPGTVSLKKMGLKGDFKETITQMKLNPHFMYEILHQNLSYKTIDAVDCIVTKKTTKVYLDDLLFAEMPHDPLDEEYYWMWAANFAELALSRKIDFVNICIMTDGECDMDKMSENILEAFRIIDGSIKMEAPEKNITYWANRQPVVEGNTCQMTFTAFPKEETLED